MGKIGQTLRAVPTAVWAGIFWGIMLGCLVLGLIKSL